MKKYVKALSCILAHGKTFHLVYEMSSFEKVEYERSGSLMWELLSKYKQLEKALDKACEELSRLNNNLDRRVITTSTYWKEYLLKEVQEDE